MFTTGNPNLVRAWLYAPSARLPVKAPRLDMPPNVQIGVVLEVEHTLRFTSVRIDHPRAEGDCWVNIWADRNAQNVRRGTAFAA